MSLLQYTYILKSTRHTLKTKILKKLSESTPQGSSIFERRGAWPWNLFLGIVWLLDKSKVDDAREAQL